MQSSRRGFLRMSLLGGAAMLGAAPLGWSVRAAAKAVAQESGLTPVALTTGTDRADMVFRALQPFAGELRRAIGGRQVVIKPNNVSIEVPLCATHAGTIEGILEFLKSIGKRKVVIAESAAGGPTLEGFSNYGYNPVAAKYRTGLMDLDQQPSKTVHVFDEKDFQPHPVRMSSVLLDRNNFIISAARMKTHDRVLATLSLKNIVFGAPIKDLGFKWGGGRQGARNDKPIAHGGGFRGINYNLYVLSEYLRPDLAVIDGCEGMQGNGPVGGTAVDHRVCVAGLDWLAADRVAVELMGIDYAKVGYLNFCARAGRGQGDLSKIEVLGPKLQDHVKTYKLSDNLEQQLVWMKRAA